MSTDVQLPEARSHPRSLKERQREEREALILQAAEEVLGEKGYYDTSMEEIAARVGIAKGTVYLHFPSKEDLVAALIAREVTTFLQAVEQAAALPVPARERLERILHDAYSGISGSRTALVLSLSNSTDVRTRLIEKQDPLRAHMARLAAGIQTVIEEGKAGGEFDRNIPTPVMLATFMALLSPKAYERLLRDGQLSPEDLVAQVGSIYFHGISINSSGA